MARASRGVDLGESFTSGGRRDVRMGSTAGGLRPAAEVETVALVFGAVCEMGAETTFGVEAGAFRTAAVAADPTATDERGALSATTSVEDPALRASPSAAAAAAATAAAEAFCSNQA